MKKLIALTLTMIFAIAPLWGCGQKVNDNDVDQTEELQGGAMQDRVSFDGGFHVNLDYFRADRYAATITEDADYVFWADNDGLHKYNKATEEMVLLLEGKEMKKSYEEFITPVFIMNALIRSMESGKREEINLIKI